MNLIDGVIFDTNLLNKNSFVRITYTGFLIKSHSKKIYAHIGYDSSWIDVMDFEMKKNGIGYELIIKLPSNFSSINFAFKNDSNIWDNNWGRNFSFDLIKLEKSKLIPVTQESINGLYFKKNNNTLRKFKLFFMKMKNIIPKIFFNNHSFDIIL